MIVDTEKLAKAMEKWRRENSAKAKGTAILYSTENWFAGILKDVEKWAGFLQEEGFYDGEA